MTISIDADLDIIGQLENIAPGENMHSARFMGDKLYLVTFKQIDPFFVIDLSENQPKILGELKIPGFSDYLHPYDENLIIGIGRDAAENQWGGAQELGVKISMFDVSDVNNPTQVDYVVIGDWKAHSASLHDHKSVLVDKKRAFMSIPIHDNGTLSFFVYGITENGKFVPAGEVKHGTEHASHDRARSLYIGDFLYTITPSLIKINDLNNIGSEINKVVLENKHQIIRYE